VPLHQSGAVRYEASPLYAVGRPAGRPATAYFREVMHNDSAITAQCLCIYIPSLHVYCQIWALFVLSVLHKMLSDICEGRENRAGDNVYLVMYKLYNLYITKYIYYCVHSDLPLASALHSMSADNILISGLFEIHVETTFPPTPVSFKWCLRFRCSG
jgi:hypothetical protein